MICPKCGEKNPDRNRFCTKCGLRLKIPADIPEPESVQLTPAEPGVPARPVNPSDSFTDTIVMEPFFADDDYGQETVSLFADAVKDEEPEPEEGSAEEPAEEPVLPEETAEDDFLSDYLDRSKQKPKPPVSPDENTGHPETAGNFVPPAPPADPPPAPPAAPPKREDPAEKDDPVKKIMQIPKDKLILYGIIAVMAVALIIMGIKLLNKPDDPAEYPDNDPADTEQTDPSYDSDDVTEEEEPEAESMEALKTGKNGLKKEAYDINYSQAGDIDNSGVDFLIKIENSNDYPVKAVYFKYYQDDDAVRNTRSGDDMFMAYGYVDARSAGYMYCRMHVPADTERTKGKIRIKSAVKATDIPDYIVPRGSITGRHMNGKKDYYDVSISNDNSFEVSSGAIAIAVLEGRENANYPLADSWGCGELPYEIDGYGSADYDEVIANPGMSHYGEDNWPIVYVIDPYALNLELD